MPPERSESKEEKRPPPRTGEGEAPESEGYAPRTNEDRGESVGDPDVLLNVPVLNVDKLDLEVEDLRARISFQAELADVVKINVGIDVEVGKAKIEIEGIQAQAQLKARLDNVRAIFSEALNALQMDPELAQNMLRSAETAEEVGAGPVRDTARTEETTDRTGGAAAEEAGSPAESAEVGRHGQDIAEVPENETESVAGGSDGAVGEEESSNLEDLPIEEEYIDEKGRVVGRAWDESGNVVEG
jgi:hypothetical protein